MKKYIVFEVEIRTDGEKHEVGIKDVTEKVVVINKDLRRNEKMDYQLKEVYFDNFCSQCEFKNNAEKDPPCDECLEEPVNEYSHKPVKFKRKES